MSETDAAIKEAIVDSLRAEFYKEQRDQNTKFYEAQSKQTDRQDIKFRWLVGFVVGVLGLGLAIMKYM